jgi:hypothetical protein
MRKTIFFGILMIFTLSSSMLFAGPIDQKSNNVNPTDKPKTENKLSDEEVSRLTKRVEEIRTMDKSALTVVEKRALRKELRGIKETVKKNGGVIYISGGAILIIILILILL